MLRRNYRAHESLLELPSRLFYNGGLIAAAPRSATHTLVGWEALLAPHYRSATREEELPSAPPLPLLLWGVSGVLERDIDSPSYFNRAESQVVVDIVEALLESPHVECGTIDIETRRETRCETCARDMVLDPGCVVLDDFGYRSEYTIHCLCLTARSGGPDRATSRPPVPGRNAY